MERFGYMDHTANEYVVTTPAATKSQENFIFNDRYFACVDQCGSGYSRYGDAEGHYTTIVAGPSEPCYEPSFQTSSRLIYVRDDQVGEFWSAGYFPVCREAREYECRHGAGYTRVRSVTNGIALRWRLFVPLGVDPVEIWTVRIENTSGRPRRLSLFAFAELSLRCDAPLYGHES